MVTGGGRMSHLVVQEVARVEGTVREVCCQRVQEMKVKVLTPAAVVALLLLMSQEVVTVEKQRYLKFS